MGSVCTVGRPGLEGGAVFGGWEGQWCPKPGRAGAFLPPTQCRAHSDLTPPFFPGTYLTICLFASAPLCLPLLFWQELGLGLSHLLLPHSLPSSSPFLLPLQPPFQPPPSALPSLAHPLSFLLLLTRGGGPSEWEACR